MASRFNYRSLKQIAILRVCLIRAIILVCIRLFLSISKHDAGKNQGVYEQISIVLQPALVYI